jgi:hypothetical protein
MACKLGLGATLTETKAELLQFAGEVPITVYEVLMVGLTVTELPLKLPGFQRILVAPEAFMVIELPLQRL